MKVIMAQKILQANQDIAEQNRKRLSQILTVNLIGSPGAGKTALLERTIASLKREFTVGVIEGDIYTTLDAERIAGQGVEVVQINTEGACHLDASMLSSALEGLDLSNLELIFIENVGNLVCPAEFDLGEDYKVALLSVTEGSDKPAKYPLVFREARAIVVTKADLLPHTNFDLKAVEEEIKAANPAVKIFVTSAQTGEGLEAWCSWLKDAMQRKRGLFAIG
ncbi:Hydrogenase accessory protein HypB [Moorella glycerini]|uniref:Hydrogenase isoenzymes nickel incorporation protein HypB n=1 Tax=Neomoorella stamsii TaxID=1266720 RepID=A0A9X7J0S2_9FIRM|nr:MULTISPECIES: hydrogenase nickel incorporation protein HypB [Moorella]PRR68927.1 Hydrogenase isoenzymes nickel incorporation protein HypB [Moorella stamsii]GEA18652.1 hydrogenase nickel incorporation protein HypB [Moorella sp. E306M]CEP67548.1 Hydrogenase accessory protein HypB [Moorella glycerini]